MEFTEGYSIIINVNFTILSFIRFFKRDSTSLMAIFLSQGDE